MIWEYDDLDKWWLTGEPRNGAGVQKRADKKYYGNACLDEVRKEVGPFERKEDALAMCELELEMLRKQKEKQSYDYEPY
jgi:hypothetical protein